MRRIVAAAVVLVAVAGCADPGVTGAPPAGQPASAEPASGQGWVPVVEVVDGDTVKVERDGETVTLRLIGIDTPESVHPTRPVECYGPKASEQAHRLLDGQRVRLEFDPSQGRLDRYGRTLAYVWLRDGRMFNEVMIRGGFAEEYTYDLPYKYQSRFRAAERAAKDRGTGLWGACAGAEAEPIAEPKPAGGTDPRFGSCREAVGAGYGPYVRGRDPEYAWYVDGDGDGVVCES